MGLEVLMMTERLQDPPNDEEEPIVNTDEVLVDHGQGERDQDREV